MDRTLARGMKVSIFLSAALLVTACTATPQANLTTGGAPPYSRSEFGGWARTGPGCDTRDTILARDLTQVTVVRGCDVIDGMLRDPYSGRVVIGRASRFDVDHIVPLAYIWRGGAWRWTKAKRMQVANDPRNLRTTLREVNRGKSDKDVGEWTPLLNRCGYAREFDAIADRYSLADMGRNSDVAAVCGR